MKPTISAKSYQEILRTTQQRILPVRGGAGYPKFRAWLPSVSGVDEIFPNMSRLWEIPSATAYGPLMLSRVRRLYQSLGRGAYGGWQSLNCRSLDILAVRFVLMPVNLSSEIDGLNETQRWKYIEQVNDSVIYENLWAMPRAWLVPEVVTAQPEEIVNTIRFTSKLPDGRDFNPKQVALIEKEINFNSQNDISGCTVNISHISDNELTIKTNCQSSSFLVLSDTYYPGWQASIDKKNTQILQTNYLLRGIVVPSGEHKISFQFKPTSFFLGIRISMASLALLLLVVLKDIGVKLSRVGDNLT